jgi:glutamate-1-semialdehyde 2,1-aminomutase
MSIDRKKLVELVQRERSSHESRTTGSRGLYSEADNLFGRVPMTWMNKWSGGYPLYLHSARGNRIVDVDGNEYVDFSLGDTGAMAGHSPEPTVTAVHQRISVEGGR